MKKILLIILLDITAHHTLLAQPKQGQELIDSLLTVLKSIEEKTDTKIPTMNDTLTVNVLCQLSKTYWYDNPDRAIDYAKQSLVLSGKIGFKKGMGFAYYSMGVGKVWKGDYLTAMRLTKISLKIGEQTDDKQIIASSYLNIGVIYAFQSNFPEALKNFFTALKTAEEIGDKQTIAWSYTSIGYIFSEQYNYPEALKYHFLALKIREEIEDKQGISNSYINIGYVYQQQGNYPEALRYYFSDLKICEELADTAGIAGAYDQIGQIYSKQNKYNEASQYLNKGLEFAKEKGRLMEMEIDYQNLAEVNSAQAASHLNPLQKRGKYAIRALEYYKLFINAHDSMFNSDNTKKLTQLEMQYDFDKRQDSIKAAQDKKDALAIAEIKNQKTIRNFSYAGALAVLSFAGVGFYRYKKRRKLQSQQEMLNERLRISRELHDDIGSTLGSISIYSEVAKNRSVKNENADEAIAKIGNASRELIDKMSDIVWSLNPDNESFEQLLNRIQVFAAIMLTPHEILYNIYTDEQVKKLKLTVEERKNIYLIYKEAVHNIVKYAECSEVEIRMSVNDGQFAMIIKDNGKGFDTNRLQETLGGNGIKNMQARAEAMNASLTIHSVIMGGTVIELKHDA